MTPFLKWQIVWAIEDMNGDPSKILYQMNDLFRPKERLEISNNADFEIGLNCCISMQKIELFEICVGNVCFTIFKSWAFVFQPPPPPPPSHRNSHAILVCHCHHI
jgi:hypothetical protein